MKIQPFQLERYLAEHEFSAPHLLCCSDCESLSVQELLQLEPGTEEKFFRLRLGYTPASGNPSLRSEIAKLYYQIEEKHILVHSGAEEAILDFMNVMLDGGDSRRFCNDLVRQSGVLLLPGKLYRPEYRSNFRIGYGRVDLPDCIEKLRLHIDISNENVVMLQGN